MGSPTQRYGASPAVDLYGITQCYLPPDTGEREERRLSSPNGSSRGKTEALELNSEIPRVSIPR